MTPNSASIEECCHKHQAGKCSSEGVLQLASGIPYAPGSYLGLLGRPPYTRLGVGLEQIFPGWHVWWLDSIGDWNPEGAAYNDPRNWRPESMRQQAEEFIVQGTVFGDAS